LLRSISIEADVRVKAELVGGLGRLLVTNAANPIVLDYTMALEVFAKPDEPFPVRYEAAHYLTKLQKEAISDQTVDTLKDILLHPDLCGVMWFSVQMIVEDICELLWPFPLARQRQILSDVLLQLTQPEDAHDIAIHILDLAFLGHQRSIHYSGDAKMDENYIWYDHLPDGYLEEVADNSMALFRIRFEETADEARFLYGDRFYPKSATSVDLSKLTDDQKAAINLVLDVDMPWMIHSNFLEMYGFPASRSATRKLLHS
jgi:hypothetical protein